MLMNWFFAESRLQIPFAFACSIQMTLPPPIPVPIIRSMIVLIIDFLILFAVFAIDDTIICTWFLLNKSLRA